MGPKRLDSPFQEVPLTVLVPKSLVLLFLPLLGVASAGDWGVTSVRLLLIIDIRLEPQEPIIPGATKCDSAAMSLPKPVAGPCILPHGAACIVQRGDHTSMSLSLMPWRSHPHGVPPANQAGGPSATSKSFVPLAALELDRSPPLALLRLTVRHGKWARIDGQGSRRVGFSLLVGARVHVARRGHFSAKQSAPAKQTTYY